VRIKNDLKTELNSLDQESEQAAEDVEASLKEFQRDTNLLFRKLERNLSR